MQYNARSPSSSFYFDGNIAFSASPEMNSNSTRYLPTYQDVIVSYSLRLPTYRSSYVRRYHPYARYTTPIVQEQFMDEIDYDEPLLDLSILDRRVEPTTIEDANQRSNLLEHAGEEQPQPPVPMADVEAIDVDNSEQEELNEQPDQNIAFIRVDVTSNS